MDHARAMGSYQTIEWEGKVWRLSPPTLGVQGRQLALFQKWYVTTIGERRKLFPEGTDPAFVEAKVMASLEAAYDKIEAGQLGVDSPEFKAWANSESGVVGMLQAVLERFHPDVTQDQITAMFYAKAGEIIEALRLMAPKGVAGATAPGAAGSTSPASSEPSSPPAGSTNPA